MTARPGRRRRGSCRGTSGSTSIRTEAACFAGSPTRRWCVTGRRGALFFAIPLFILTDNSRLGVLLPPGLAVLGGAVGLAAWRLARHDLARMRGGVIDPAGEWEARFAHDRGRNCFVLSVSFMVFWANVLLV